ncbi:MAG TPA: protein kinase [Steroidobacteraceae bacterium]|nr:protein kinase [Steroidobacteraceae bacterium]
MGFAPPEAGQWQRIAPYLDQALDLPGEERERWLNELAHAHPDIADAVRKLLQEHADLQQRGFLAAPILNPVRQALLRETAGAGEQVGAYRLIREIGRGGMSSVWLAQRCDGQLQRDVALKLPLQGPRKAEFVERFKRERDILATLTHPNIARLYDAGVTTAGQPYLAMEHVDGKSLTTYCDDARLSIRERLRLFLQVLAAVEFAHSQLVLHRDLKPSNILVTPQARVVLLDFGIAKLLSPDAPSAGAADPITQFAEGPLTPDYASPEQLAAQPVGTASDIYSLGVVLHEVLVGTRAFGAVRVSRRQLEEAILTRDPPRPSQLNPTDAVAAARRTTPRRLAQTLKGDLDTIVLKALKKAPAERYLSVGAFSQDIANYLASLPVSARPDSGWYRTRRFVARHKVQVTAAVAAVLALGVGFGTAVWQGQRAEKHRATAVEMLANSEATLDFMRAVLRDGVRNDETLTIDDLYSRSEALAEQLGKGDPRTRAVASDFVAWWYIAHDQFDRADKVLTRVIDSLPENLPVRSSLICNRAYARSQLGLADEAAATIDQEIAHHAPDDPALSTCLDQRTSLAISLNDGRHAVTYALQALHHFEATGQQSLRQKSSLLGQVASAYAVQGLPDRAQEYYQQSFDLLESLGRGDSLDAGALLSNWGVAMFAAGNPLRAYDLLERSIEIDRRRSLTGEQAQYTSSSLGSVLRALGRYPEADAAYDIALGAKPDPQAQVYAIVSKARVAVLEGQLQRAQQLLDQAAAIMRERHVDEGTSGSLVHRLVQGQIWAGQGRAADAETAFTGVLDTYTKLDCCSGPRAQALVARAGVRVARHQLDAAGRDAQEAVRFAEQGQGQMPASSTTGQSWLMLAQVEQAQGRTGEAKRAYALAVRNLVETLGEQHPDTVRARKGMSDT